MQAEARVRFWWDQEAGCYDLEVLDPEATVADYEQAAALVLAAPDAVRRYGNACIGCSICCGGRLPLTSVDLYRLKLGGLGWALGLDGWVAAHGSLQRQGRRPDILLRLDENETCALWDRQRGVCRHYESRPLICRTYTCAPLSWRAAELRGQVVNAGEDELAALLGLVDDGDGGGQPRPFAGIVDYRSVPLRGASSARLWRGLVARND